MIEHLSYSSISTYLACPRSWMFKYVERIPVPEKIEFTFGKAFHQVIERNAEGWQNSLIELWSAAFLEHTSNKAIEWAENTPEDLYNLGVRMFSSEEVQSTLRQIKPKRDANGAMIERKVSLTVEGVGVPIIGFIDMIHEDGTVCDFKTAAKSWADGKASDEMQPLFYFAALDQMQIAHQYQFRHYVFVKTKTPKVQVLETTRKPIEVDFLLKVIRGVWQGISAGVFMENPTGWKCSPKYCEYFGMCIGKYQ